jgi:hypothetical protein
VTTDVRGQYRKTHFLTEGKYENYKQKGIDTYISNLDGVDEPFPARELVARSARQRMSVVEHHTAVRSDGGACRDGVHGSDT